MVSLEYLEDLEAGDVEHADEILPLVLGVERLVAAHDQPGEHARVDGFRQSGDGVDNLRKHARSLSTSSHVNMQLMAVSHRAAT